MEKTNWWWCSGGCILRWRHWRPWVTGCREVGGPKHWYKQRSQLQEQQTHFFEQLTSHAPEEHTKSQRLPCTYSNGVPMTSTAPPIQKMMSTLEASKTGAVRENRVIRSFSTGQQSWHWSCPLWSMCDLWEKPILACTWMLWQNWFRCSSH